MFSFSFLWSSQTILFGASIPLPNLYQQLFSITKTGYNVPWCVCHLYKTLLLRERLYSHNCPILKYYRLTLLALLLLAFSHCLWLISPPFFALFYFFLFFFSLPLSRELLPSLCKLSVGTSILWQAHTQCFHQLVVSFDFNLSKRYEHSALPLFFMTIRVDNAKTFFTSYTYLPRWEL